MTREVGLGFTNISETVVVRGSDPKAVRFAALLLSNEAGQWHGVLDGSKFRYVTKEHKDETWQGDFIFCPDPNYVRGFESSAKAILVRNRSSIQGVKARFMTKKPVLQSVPSG